MKRSSFQSVIDGCQQVLAAINKVESPLRAVTLDGVPEKPTCGWCGAPFVEDRSLDGWARCSVCFGN